MKKIFLSVLAGLLFLPLLWLNATRPADAAPVIQLTAFLTPTPQEDGRILYTVQEGDTLWRISGITGVPLEELRRLNNLDPDDIIIPGQVLLLGFGGPSAQATSPITGETPTPPGPTPTFGPGSGSICVLLFDDLNGNSLREETEPGVAGGAISITQHSGPFSGNQTTDGSVEPVCFPDLSADTYTVSVGIPENYNPTTALNKEIVLASGDTVTTNFGAQINTAGLGANPGPAEGGRSPLWGFAGVTLLLLGIALGVYSMRMGKQPLTR